MGLTLQTWSLTHPHRKKLQRLQSGDGEAKRPPTVTKWFFLLWASSGWFRSSEQLRHLVATHWCDQWQMNCFYSDHIMSRLSKVFVTSMLSQHCEPACFLHHPFQNQPLSIHELNKLMSSPCYSPASNMPPCLRDIMAPRRCHISNFGLGWRGCHLSSLSRSGVRCFCLQMVTILSTFWHQYRLEISQY